MLSRLQQRSCHVSIPVRIVEKEHVLLRHWVFCCPHSNNPNHSWAADCHDNAHVCSYINAHGFNFLQIWTCSCLKWGSDHITHRCIMLALYKGLSTSNVLTTVCQLCKSESYVRFKYGFFTALEYSNEGACEAVQNIAVHMLTICFTTLSLFYCCLN